MAMEHPLELTCVSEAAYKSMIKDIDDDVDFAEKYGAGAFLRLPGSVCAWVVHDCAETMLEYGYPMRRTEDIYESVQESYMDTIWGALPDVIADSMSDMVLDANIWTMCCAEARLRGIYDEDEEEDE